MTNPWLWALAGLGFAALFGATEVRRFERAAAQDVASKLQGEHRKVALHTRPRGLFGYAHGDLASVTIDASDFSTEELPLFTMPDAPETGCVGNLNLRLNDFTLAGLKVLKLEAAIPGCRYDFAVARKEKRIVLSRSGVGKGRVWIEEAALGPFVEHKFHELTHVNAVISDGLVHIEGDGDFIMFKTHFAVDGKVEASSPTTLSVKDATILFNGRVADAASSDVLMKALNPVVDLDKDLHLHGAIQMAGVQLTKKRLQAWGAVHIPDLGQ